MNDPHTSQGWQLSRSKTDERGREVRLYRLRHDPARLKRVIFCTARYRFNFGKVSGRFVCVEFASMSDDPLRWRSNL